jgi:hypothetical protein
MARCPAHNDGKPSLSIREADDAKVLVHCHAGCDQPRVIAVLRARGLWAETGPGSLSHSGRAPIGRKPDQDDAKHRKAALAIWQSAKPAEGTLVETYLASRGLRPPPWARLRFHASLRHSSGGIWPAIIALVTRGIDDTPLAIHRTFIARDGRGKAPVDPPRMTLGSCRGGAVWLKPAGDVLMVGEGIETSLAVMQATGYPAWAALSTSGLKCLELPAAIRNVIVLADGDEPGEAAARDCAWRWKREGRRVRIARPPWGMDFNDMLVSSAPRAEEGAQ